jgi:hypothetical protein
MLDIINQGFERQYPTGVASGIVGGVAGAALFNAPIFGRKAGEFLENFAGMSKNLYKGERKKAAKKAGKIVPGGSTIASQWLHSGLISGFLPEYEYVLDEQKAKARDYGVAYFND